ncbi:MAG: hypothetical protein QXR53_02765 [Candidatus Norongarragalinales archaeon]
MTIKKLKTGAYSCVILAIIILSAIVFFAVNFMQPGLKLHDNDRQKWGLGASNLYPGLITHAFIHENAEHLGTNAVFGAFLIILFLSYEKKISSTSYEKNSRTSHRFNFNHRNNRKPTNALAQVGWKFDNTLRLFRLSFILAYSSRRLQERPGSHAASSLVCTHHIIVFALTMILIYFGIDISEQMRISNFAHALGIFAGIVTAVIGKAGVKRK